MVSAVAFPVRAMIVRKFIDSLGFRCIFTNRTCKRFYTIFRTGRLGGYIAFIPSVFASCRQFIVRGIITAVPFTRFIRFPTYFRTRWSLGFMIFFVVSKSRQFIVRGIITAVPFTRFIRFPTYFRTRWSLGFMIFFVVSKSRQFIVCSVVTTVPFTRFVRFPAYFRTRWSLGVMIFFVVV